MALPTRIRFEFPIVFNSKPNILFNQFKSSVHTFSNDFETVLTRKRRFFETEIRRLCFEDKKGYEGLKKQDGTITPWEVTR